MKRDKWREMQDILEKSGGKITDRQIRSIFSWFSTMMIIFILKRDGTNFNYYKRDIKTGRRQSHLKVGGTKPEYETVFEIIFKG